MAKIIIDDLLDETSFLNDANLRFQQIEDELNNNVLYRNNPVGEPNGMFNDLDMQEKDILNAGVLNAKTIVLDGTPFDGAVNWGNIGGTLSDQTDLEQRLQDAANSGVADLIASDTNGTSLGLEVVNDGNGNYEIQYSDRVNKEAFGLITLNEFGKVPTELLSASAILLLGFFRGDNLCPKPFDTGTPPVPPSTPCTGPDYRNPSEVYAGFAYQTGHAYVVSFLPPEVTGEINLVDPTDPIGPIVPINLVVGDMIVYIEEVSIGATTVAQAGWYKWEQAVQINSADNTIYDPTGNVIIDPASINVDLALTDLDAKCDTVVSVDAKDAGLQAQIDTNEADIITNGVAIVANEARITQNEIDIAANSVLITANSDAIQVNADAIATKLPVNQFATPDGVTPGIVRTDYDAGTNTLTIFSS